MKNIFFVFGILLLAGCSGNKNETKQNTEQAIENRVTLTPAQMKTAALVTGTPESRMLSSQLKLNGKIDVPPQNIVSVSMPLGGYLTSTKLLPGMHVQKGEVIAVMEDQQYIQLQQEYLSTKAHLQYAEQEYNRQKDLNQSKASSDKVYQQALMEYTDARVALSALGEKLKLIQVNPNTLTEVNLSRTVSLVSPINGFVSKVNVNIGKYVKPEDILFELVNPDDIHLNLTVFEKDLGALRIGQKLVAYTNHEPEKKHNCEIILISKDLSDERTADVHCHFEDYDKTLLPGMYMNAILDVVSENRMAVPEDAVVSFEGKSYVFAEAGENTFEMLNVSTGITQDGYLEITDATRIASRKIVLKGAYTLLMALKNKSEE